MSAKFETWPIEKLVPYARNPRDNDHAVEKIASSIREYGFRIPVVAKSDGSLVDGHLRLKAAQKLGLTEVPVVLADDLTEAQIKAFRLDVNRVAEEANWDMEMLRLEIEELEELGFDLSLIAFDADELDAIRFDDDVEADLPELADGDREPFQQKTFTLHDDQAEIVDEAIKAAKEMGPFGQTGNENGNGNSIARICEMFLGNFGNPDE